MSGSPESDARKRKERRRRTSRIISWIGVSAAVLGLIPAYLGLYALRRNVRHVETRVAELALASQFRVTSPLDSVGSREVVRGVTPYVGMNYCVVVTPVATGIDHVQAGTVTLNGTEWTGYAQFGESDAHVGQRFLIRAIATKGTLQPPKRIDKLPPDAFVTPSVIVTRTR